MANKKQREIVFNKYKGKCSYCGCTLVKGWHVDHLEPCRSITREDTIEQPEGIYPRFKYVTKVVGFANPEANHIDNLMPSCASCNMNKHSGSLENFRELIQGFMNHLNELSTQYKIAKRYGLIQETVKPIVFYFETQHS